MYALDAKDGEVVVAELSGWKATEVISESPQSSTGATMHEAARCVRRSHRRAVPSLEPLRRSDGAGAAGCGDDGDAPELDLPARLDDVADGLLSATDDE